MVIDHLAGLHVNVSNAEDIAALFALADLGAWLKVSAYYRLGAVAPFDEFDSLIATLHERFIGRLLWGSDWPHTWYMEAMRGGAPPYESLLAPLTRAFPDAAVRKSVLYDVPERIYR